MPSIAGPMEIARRWHGHGRDLPVGNKEVNGRQATGNRGERMNQEEVLKSGVVRGGCNERKEKRRQGFPTDLLPNVKFESCGPGVFLAGLRLWADISAWPVIYMGRSLRVVWKGVARFTFGIKLHFHYIMDSLLLPLGSLGSVLPMYHHRTVPYCR